MSERRIRERAPAGETVGRTDWARLDAMTEEEIEANALSDPDNPPLTDEQLQDAELVMPGELGWPSVSLRLDPEVLLYFQEKGAGYQARITEVLRSYVRAQKQKGRLDSPQAPDLETDLRQFVDRHPFGWDVRAWIGLLNDLRARGHDTSDEARIGTRLERIRLEQRLRQVPGLAPQSVQALVQEFGSVWALRNTGREEIANAAGIPLEMVERVVGFLR